MRYWPLLLLVGLAGCTQATASKIDTRTYSIQGPIVAGGSDAPDRRLAEKICPKGYRVLDHTSHTGANASEADRGANADMENPGLTTNWTIRCL